MEYQLWGTLEQQVRKLEKKRPMVPFGHPAQVKTFKNAKDMMTYLEFMDDTTYNKFRRKPVGKHDDMTDMTDITVGMMNMGIE
jgi:hypothetical protein